MNSRYRFQHSFQAERQRPEHLPIQHCPSLPDPVRELQAASRSDAPGPSRPNPYIHNTPSFLNRAQASTFSADVQRPLRLQNSSYTQSTDYPFQSNPSTSTPFVNSPEVGVNRSHQSQEMRSCFPGLYNRPRSIKKRAVPYSTSRPHQKKSAVKNFLRNIVLVSPNETVVPKGSIRHELYDHGRIIDMFEFNGAWDAIQTTDALERAFSAVLDPQSPSPR
eukprot:Em0016g1061a